MRRRRVINLPASQGAQESNQTCRGTLLMWEWIISRTSIEADFLPFLPSSNPCTATVNPRRSQRSSSKCHSFFKRSTGNFTEVEKECPLPTSGSVEGSHFLGPVNYMIFGVLGGYPIHVCESSSMSGTNFLPMLETHCKRSHERHCLFTKILVAHAT